MAGTALRSFFINMGYAVDATSERRFLGSIASATLGARNLGTAVAATASAVAAAVAHISASYEDLYYASKRTASSVESIRAYTYAISQLGGSSDSAKQSLENLGRNLRLNPGYGQMLRDLGVATSQNGKLRETTAILADFGKVAQRLPYRVGFQYAQALGIDENTYRAIRDNARALEEYENEYRRMAQSVGLNSEKAAEAGKEFMNASRSLGEAITVIFDKLTEEYAPTLTRILEEFRDWMISHFPEIKQAIEETGKALLEFARAIPGMITAMKGAYETFDEWAKKIGGDQETGIGLAFKLIAAYLAGAWLASVVRTMAGAAAAIGPVAKMLATLYVVNDVYQYFKDPKKYEENARKDIEGTKEEQEQSKKDEEVSRREGGFVAGFLKRMLGTGDSQMGNGPNSPGTPGGGDSNSRWWDPRTWGGGSGGGGGGGSAGSGGGGGGGSGGDGGSGGSAGHDRPGKWWTPERQQYAIDKLKAGGLSELGAKALVARWSAVEAPGGPGSVNPKSGAFGIGQWLTKDRLDPIRGNTDFDAQLQHAIKELNGPERAARDMLNRARTPAEAAAGASRYERAEGFDPSTGRDNFTDATERAMGRLGEANNSNDAPAPAGTAPSKDGTVEITSKGGAKFRVAAEFAKNFQGFIDDYEKAGGVIGPNSGGLSARPGNASYHPLGRAIDVNQIGRGVRGGGKSLPPALEDALAQKWGLRSGNSFSNNDQGHFEVHKRDDAMAALEAMGIIQRPHSEVPSPPDPPDMSGKLHPFDAAGQRAAKEAKAGAPSPPQSFDRSRFDIPKLNQVPNGGRSFLGSSPVGPGYPTSNDNSLSADIKTSNTFNIYGAQDPVNTATEVNRRQSNVANGTLRDLKGVVR